LRWWAQWRERWARPLPADRLPKSEVASTLEPLEGRIAPAGITPGFVVFTDLEGDTATVNFSKYLCDPRVANASFQMAAIKNAFKFANAAGDSAFDSTGPNRL
jgi:hypothetical protein